RRGGTTARSVRGLQEQRRALSDLSEVFPRLQATFPRRVGQERPVLSAARGRGVQARYTGRSCAFFRYRTFRARDPRRGDCGGHPRHDLKPSTMNYSIFPPLICPSSLCNKDFNLANSSPVKPVVWKIIVP